MVTMNKIYKDKKVINIIDDASDLDLHLSENQMVIINCFFYDISNMRININQLSNSYLVINYAGYVQNNANVFININVNGNNNTAIVNARTIAEKNHTTFEVKIKANEKTSNNEITEDLKAINEEGSISFLPILQVDTNEVSAEHYATIGGFDKKNLFYLEAKGISTKMAKDILKRSFINCLFSDNFLKMLNNGKEKNE